jgi:hypothetical protein
MLEGLYLIVGWTPLLGGEDLAVRGSSSRALLLLPANILAFTITSKRFLKRPCPRTRIRVEEIIIRSTEP